MKSGRDGGKGVPELWAFPRRTRRHPHRLRGTDKGLCIACAPRHCVASVVSEGSISTSLSSSRSISSCTLSISWPPLSSTGRSGRSSAGASVSSRTASQPTGGCRSSARSGRSARSGSSWRRIDAMHEFPATDGDPARCRAPGAVQAALWRLGGNARRPLEAVPAGCLGHAVQHVALADKRDPRPSVTLQGDGAAVDSDHPGVTASAYISPSVAHRSNLVGRIILDDERHLAIDVAITAGLYEPATPGAGELARGAGSRIGRDAGDGAGPLCLGAARDESAEGGK